MNFRGAARPLADLDLPRVGSLIGVGEDEIHALIDVEASGNGFDRIGRPKMLFEPHVFWRMIDGQQRQKAVDRGLAWPKWRPGSYPKDSYPRLIAAMEIDRDAALKSASWGLGQVMGFNALLAGYRGAEAMVTAFLDSEAEQLAGMVRFIIASGLDDELRRHDWRGFARGYNGFGYAAHGYHLRLAESYERWRRIKDTPP